MLFSIFLLFLNVSFVEHLVCLGNTMLFKLPVSSATSTK